MEYAYAVRILNETGEEINESNLTGVLDAAGASVQESRVKALVAALEDVDVDAVGEERTREYREEDAGTENTDGGSSDGKEGVKTAGQGGETDEPSKTDTPGRE